MRPDVPGESPAGTTAGPGDDPDVRRAARILWDYHRLGQEIRPADCLVVPGSHDLRVADHAARLYREGYAPLIVFSGGVAHKGDLLDPGWDRPEADVFAERALLRGVPEEAVLRERRAAHTGENMMFSDALLRAAGHTGRRILLVQKPYMERRALATALAQCPRWEVRVTSPPITFDDYPDPGQGLTRDILIHIMVGDLQRILTYPDRGFQVAQNVPEPVMAAYRDLRDRGFDGHITG